MTPTALTIAGSDSGGGAGIQADLKSFSARGVYGASVITAITAQNTREVRGVEPISDAMVAAQIAAVLDDIDVHAIKIGMLGQPALIETVANSLADFTGPVVLDPVMITKSGARLLEDAACDALITHLIPRATILTPNLPEAASLLGQTEAANDALMLDQGRQLLTLGAQSVLMKGGHATGNTCIDWLITPEGETRLSGPRIATGNTHGTGCSMSSAIAAELAKGRPLPDAVQAAHGWLHQAIRTADTLHIGTGHGPVHHFHEHWQ